MPTSTHHRVRRPLLRRPRRVPRSAYPWWAAVLTLSLVTFTVVSGAVGRAAQARARYGDPRPVLVATTALHPGDRLDHRHTALRSLPSSLVPAGALTGAADGRIVLADIAAGEPVVGLRVSGRGRGGATALMPAGTRAVAVPTPVAGLPVRPGDHVDLLAASGGDGRVVAPDGTVVAVTAQSTTVAVDATDAPRVAAALGAGSVVIALRNP